MPRGRGDRTAVTDRPTTGGTARGSPPPLPGLFGPDARPAPSPTSPYVSRLSTSRWRACPWYAQSQWPPCSSRRSSPRWWCWSWLAFRSPGRDGRTSTEARRRTDCSNEQAVAHGRTLLRHPPSSPPPLRRRRPTYSAHSGSTRAYSEPTPAQKPRVDVPRAPMSVAPGPEKPIPAALGRSPARAQGRATPRHGCFLFLLTGSAEITNADITRNRPFRCCRS